MNIHEEIMLRLALSEGRFQYDFVKFKLRSGRKFRYKMTDYPFAANASPIEIDLLVCQIIKDKYRYCQWDREHAKDNQEVEIFDAIKLTVMELGAGQQR